MIKKYRLPYMATTAPVSDASIVFLPVGKVCNSNKDGDTKSSDRDCANFSPHCANFWQEKAFLR